MKYTTPSGRYIELFVDPGDGGISILIDDKTLGKCMRVFVLNVDKKEFCERVAKLADGPGPVQERGKFED